MRQVLRNTILTENRSTELSGVEIIILVLNFPFLILTFLKPKELRKKIKLFSTKELNN